MLEQDDSRLLFNHRLVCMTSKLTEHGWRRIKGELVEFMQSVRKKRLNDEFERALKERWVMFKTAGKELLNDYLDEHPEMRVYGLNIADLARTPEIREILCTPADVPVDEQSFMALRAEMGTIVEGWKASACDDLRQMVRHATQASRDADVEPLELAATWFECERCVRVLFYPNVFAHKCLRSGRTRPLSVLPNHPRKIYELSVRAKFPKAFEEPSRILTVRSPRIARRVIRFCDENPDIATAEDMDALDIRLVQDDTTIMTWRAAIVEWCYFRFGDDTSSWRVATPEEVARVKERETWLIQTKTQWRCTKCGLLCALSCLGRMTTHMCRHHGAWMTASVENGTVAMQLNPDTDTASGVWKLRMTGWKT